MGATVTTQLFSYASVWIENLHVLPSGNLLLTTIESPDLLYTLNPNVASPTVTPVTTFPSDITGVTGIAPLPGNELYAITGGTYTGGAFANNTMSLFVVSLATGNIVNTIPFPGTEMMNGMAAIPSNPYVVLSADSVGGRMLRVDTLTNTVSVAFTDPSLVPGSSPPPTGVNGLKILGNYLYFTNSDQGTFARVEIDNDGNKIGAVEILAAIDGQPDEFAFDGEGNAYIAVHPSSVVKVTPEGVVTTIGNGTLFQQPTAAAIGLCDDIYVTTGGDYTNTTFAGQLLQVPI